MKLTKMHGLGNDFILFSDSQGANKDYTDLAIRLCDRRTGIGADGLVCASSTQTAAKQKCVVMAFVALQNMPMNTVKLQKILSPSKH